MISINYKITITNPIKDKLKPSEQITDNSTLTFKRTNKGVTIKGDYVSKGYLNSVGNFYGLGNKYSILDSSLVREKSVQIADVLEVLKLDGMFYKDIPINLKSYIKRVKTLSNNLKMLEDIIESKNDIVLFQLNRDGLLTRVRLDIKPYTNIIETDINNLLIYFIVNKTLNIDSINNDSFHISTNALTTLPTGFCNFITNLSKRTDNVSQINPYTYLLSSQLSQQYFCSIPVEVDGVLSKNFYTSKNDKTLITINDDHVQLHTIDLDLKDNVTAMYVVNKKGDIEPYLLYCDEDTRLKLNIDKISSNFKVRASTLNSSIENKKRYLVKQYKIKLTSKNNTIELLDQNFYQTLQYNAIQFNKKVIVND